MKMRGCTESPYQEADEIERLKTMCHQKDLEISSLKKQIERMGLEFRNAMEDNHCSPDPFSLRSARSVASESWPSPIRPRDSSIQSLKWGNRTTDITDSCSEFTARSRQNYSDNAIHSAIRAAGEGYGEGEGACRTGGGAWR